MFYLGHGNKSQNDIVGRVEDKRSVQNISFFAIWLWRTDFLGLSFTNIQKGREEINLTRMTLEILKDSI